MLSVLIPTYNYSAYPLVKEIQLQCENSNIIYEIIVLDDCSNEQSCLQENKKINKLPHSRFEENTQNLGRARNRNLLAEKAKYEWLLFMDCDTFPKEKNFISNYINEIKKDNYFVFFGGICYKNTIPSEEKLLRWKYGKNREEISILKRKRKPYETVLTSNLLISKKTFNKNKFNDSITEYGYEDLVFALELQKNNISIQHIDNLAYHLNYETSELFLIKTEKSLDNLKWIHTSNLINPSDSKIIQKWNLLKKFNLLKVYCSIFKKLSPMIRKHLLSKKISLFIFDLYKLGYFCLINSK